MKSMSATGSGVEELVDVGPVEGELGVDWFGEDVVDMEPPSDCVLILRLWWLDSTL